MSNSKQLIKTVTKQLKYTYTIEDITNKLVSLIGPNAGISAMLLSCTQVEDKPVKYWIKKSRKLPYSEGLLPCKTNGVTYILFTLKDNLTALSFNITENPVNEVNALGIEGIIYSRNEIAARLTKEAITTSCTGCTSGNCCKSQNYIHISIEEAKILQSMATEKQKERARIQLNRPTQEYRCPYLSEDNKCEVYAFRPLVCANYHVTSPKELCDGSNIVKQVDPSNNILTLAMIGLADDILTECPIDLIDIFKADIND